MASTSFSVPSVQLGVNGPIVGAQGLGCMGMMSDYYGATDAAESVATLEHALDIGINMFDTADLYGDGKNEEFIGPVVRANRDRVVLATKFGFSPRADTPGQYSIENSPAYIRSAIDASLQRLGVDIIDIYYMHRRNRDVPLAESVGAMADLVEAGKVRFLGLSEVDGDELREANRIHPITAVQSEWSLFSRDVETSVVPVAAELGVSFVAYSPLGRGMLTGQTAPADLSRRDIRNYFPRFASDNRDSNMALVAEISALAAARNVSAAQLALAWLHHRGLVHGLTVVPIPGTRKRSRLDENAVAASLDLTSAELAAMEPIAARVMGIRPV